MTKRSWVYSDDGVTEILGMTKEAELHAVHQDTLEKPLKHPVSGRMHDSKSSYMQDCRERGERVVGNDWVGSDMSQCKPKDLIDDKRTMQAIHKAEAIQRDPARRRAWQNEQRERAKYASMFRNQGRV